MSHGLDSKYRELTEEESQYLRTAINHVLKEARENSHKRPKMTTLLEEFSELVLSFRGKHPDTPEIELIQVASCAINLLWQLYAGIDVNNIVTHSVPYLEDD